MTSPKFWNRVLVGHYSDQTRVLVVIFTWSIYEPFVVRYIITQMADNNIEINSGNKNKDFYMKIYVHINIKYSYFYDFLCYGLDVIGF